MSSAIQPAPRSREKMQYVVVAVFRGGSGASGASTVGAIGVFAQSSRQFSMPLTQVASMMNVFQSGIASFERVIEFLDAEEQSPDAAASVNPPPVRGRVELRDVTFSYDPNRPLIEPLSLLA